MTPFLKFCAAFAIVISLAAYAGAMTTLQNEEQIFEGELINIDSAAKVLTVKGAEEKEMTFAFTEQTQYRADGNSLMATRIEVIPS
jgi:hypothetical protein